MMRPLATKILLLLLCCAMSPPLLAAWAESGRLSGDVLFGMIDYRAEVAGVEVEKLSTMYEQATVRYEKQGLVSDERLGHYTLMLGYEFNAIDPERVSFGVNDATISAITAQKLYYNASMLLAPGALPFRLTLFANDLHRTTFVDAGYGELPVGNQSGGGASGHLISPDLAYDLSNGTRRQIGGSALLGIRNGSYLGAYRDYLAQLPRFLPTSSRKISKIPAVTSIPGTAVAAISLLSRLTKRTTGCIIACTSMSIISTPRIMARPRRS